MTHGSSFTLWVIDAGLTYFINSFGGQNSIVDAVMKFVSFVGVPAMVLTVASQWWSRNTRQHTRFVALSAGLAFLVALALNQIILLVVQRVRPYDVGVTHLLVSPSGDPSFPSDHASAAFAIAFAFLFCGRLQQGVVFAVCATFVAVSRVYVGTHYVGDVLGGAMTACFASLAVFMAYREYGWINQRLVSLL